MKKQCGTCIISTLCIGARLGDVFSEWLLTCGGCRKVFVLKKPRTRRGFGSLRGGPWYADELAYGKSRGHVLQLCPEMINIAEPPGGLRWKCNKCAPPFGEDDYARHSEE